MFFTGKAAVKFIGSYRTTSRLLRLGLSQGVGHGRSVAAGIQNPPASSTFGTGIPRPPSVAGRGNIPGVLEPFVTLGQRGKSTRTPYISDGQNHGFESIFRKNPSVDWVGINILQPFFEYPPGNQQFHVENPVVDHFPSFLHGSRWN